MVKAQLQLVFLPSIRCLIHNSNLDFKSIKKMVSERQIEPVAVKYLNCLSIANISLAINEDLVVKRKIDCLFLHFLGVQC